MFSIAMFGGVYPNSSYWTVPIDLSQTEKKGKTHIAFFEALHESRWWSSEAQEVGEVPHIYIYIYNIYIYIIYIYILGGVPSQ